MGQLYQLWAYPRDRQGRLVFCNGGFIAPLARRKPVYDVGVESLTWACRQCYSRRLIPKR